MAEILLFHHAQGRTAGVRAFADELQAAGHVIHVPDLYEGQIFPTLSEGVAHAEQIGFDAVIARAARAAEALPEGLVYAGFSLGVLPAQMLAQTRPGARGALLFHSCVPVAEFSESWPDNVPAQIHAMEEDPYFVGDGDLDAARELVASTPHAELFLYPGREHLFSDSSLPSYDEEAASLLRARVLDFLDTV